MKKFIEYLNEKRGPKQLPQIYIDLDQVMVDFLAGAKKQLGHDFNVRVDRTKKEIWSILDAKRDFWEQLPIMKDGKELWKFIKKYDPRILSATPLTPDAVIGKKKWIKKHLGLHDQNRINLVKRDKKSTFAKLDGEPAVLIDDYIKNIGEWKIAGGIGIRHTSAIKTIAKLKKLGY